MLSPINTNLPSPARAESPSLKLSKSAEANKIKEVEVAAKAKSLKDSTKARKESKGPILKRKMACATCRRRKLRCDAARPRCSTCARSQASAEAAGHPSAVPPGCCVYDADQPEEAVNNRFFGNSFHPLAFHAHPRMPMSPGYGMPSPYDNSGDYMPNSPLGAWPWGEYPPTPSRGAPCNSPSCNTTPMLTTPTRPSLLTSTPMRRIISPTLAINSTPIQDHDLFYSPPHHDGWNTPCSTISNTESMYFSPMVHSMSEPIASMSSMSSATSTPLLASTRALRSPHPMAMDLGTPLSIAPSTPCSESFDVNCLGPPMMPRALLSSQEQQLKCTSFLQSMEANPYGMIDFTGHNHMIATSPSMEITAGNDLGLINGSTDCKLQDPFTNSMSLDMDDASLMNLTLGNVPDYFHNAMSTNDWTV